MKTITIDGKVYVATATATPAPGERVIELDGVTYTISEIAGTVERVRINGKTYDIADVEAVEAERERAERMENQIIEWQVGDKKELQANALQYNTLHTTSSVDKISIHGRSINTAIHSFNIPSATTEKAGVMSAEDKLKLDKTQSVENVTWSASSDMNSFTTAGVYSINGARTNLGDNLPIANIGENATIAARLIVTVTPEGNTTYRHSVGQTLILSNAEGKETKVYTRNGNRTSTDGGVTYTVTWGEWANLQENVQVQVTGENGLDNLINNGIYSGVWVKNVAHVETFVMVVINNYAAAGQAGVPKSITQFKYSITVGGFMPIYETRVGASESDWGEWKNINASEFEDIKSKALQANTFSVDYTPSDHVNLYMRTLSGETRVQPIPAASQKSAGVMSAADKVALDTATTRALRALFVAAGAEYNDTGADKAKTAPWGETVVHKAGHYYLNGLGDITEEQMMDIYKYSFPMLGATDWTNAFREVNVRTNLFYKQYYSAARIKTLAAAFNANKTIEIVDFNNQGSKVVLHDAASWNYAFGSCTKLKRILGVLDINNASSLLGSNCDSLIHVQLYGLNKNLRLFHSSKNIDKESVLYAIQNASPTSAITITLHANAYARLAEDADIVAALEAQPLVTLVSA